MTSLSARAALAALLLFACAGVWSVARADHGALLAAVERGDAQAVRLALAQGTQVDTRDVRGRTALLVATYGNHIEAARALIAAGADVNAKDDIQDSPFLYAGAEGRTEILKLALAAGANLKSVNRYGGTALIPACHHGHIEAVKVLLATAIDVDHVNRLGWTALLEAVILGDGGPVYVEIVRLLVSGGANVNIADRDGVTPLAHARRRGYEAIASLLSAAGGR
jgi:ankyrin repeat protein